jgi:hypothetical protein
MEKSARMPMKANQLIQRTILIYSEEMSEDALSRFVESVRERTLMCRNRTYRDLLLRNPDATESVLRDMSSAPEVYSFGSESELVASLCAALPGGGIEQTNDILRAFRNQPAYGYLNDLPAEVLFYPGEDEACEEGRLYFDPNQSQPGRTVTIIHRSGVSVHTDDSGTRYVMGYSENSYKIFVVLGSPALARPPNSLLSTLAHEIIHVRIDRSARAERVRIASDNRRHFWELATGVTPISRAEEVSTIEERAESATGYSVSLSRVGQELLAYSMTFSHFFHIDIEEARWQICVLPYVGYGVSGVPDSLRQRTINVIAETLATEEDLLRFRREVLPAVMRVYRSRPSDIPATLYSQPSRQFREDLIRAIDSREQAIRGREGSIN